MVDFDFDALANLAFGLAIVADGVTPVLRRLRDLLVGILNSAIETKKILPLDCGLGFVTSAFEISGLAILTDD